MYELSFISTKQLTGVQLYVFKISNNNSMTSEDSIKPRLPSAARTTKSQQQINHYLHVQH